MTKAEVIQLLNVSGKTVERYAAKGRLTVHYKQGKSGGREAIFDEEEVTKLQQEIAQPKLRPASARPSQPTAQTEHDIATRQDIESVAMVLSAQFTDIVSKHFEQLANLLNQRQQQNQTFTLNRKQQQKLTLSLTEASALSGLPEEYLLKAIQRKKPRLKAIEVGKEEWRIKARDLKKFVRGL